MNNESIYSKILKQYRQETGASQLDLSRKLEVTQATISRIEKNMTIPGDMLAEKIRKLPLKNTASQIAIERNNDQQIYFNKALKSVAIKPFEISFLSFSYSKNSGDLVLIKKFSQDKSFLVLADCAGHGEDVSKMTFALKFCFESFLSVFNEKTISNQVFHSVIGSAVEGTHESWITPPAILSLIVNGSNGEIELLNNMQPRPIYYNNGLVGDLGEGLSNFKLEYVPLKSGSSLMLYTDGFNEMYEDGELKNRFLKSARAFKGDSKAILVQLLNGARDAQKGGFINSSKISDDATVVIITRGRE